jgi:hypothetical protein
LQVLAIALSPFMSVAMAQQLLPQEINTGDLIQGYLPVGAFVITKGHLAYVEQRAVINPGMPSAMVRAIVDLTRLPPATRDKVEAECAAIKITTGGCWVRLQGWVQQIDDRFGLIATDIEFLPSREGQR